MEPNLLLLQLDTARADAFSPWGGSVPTPAMAELCRQGTAYRHAVAPAPWTLSSTASLFSGLLPTDHGISGDAFSWAGGRPTSPAGAIQRLTGPWLPEALRERGYMTWAASCNSWVSPWAGFDRGFDRFVYLHDKARLPTGVRGRFMRSFVRAAGLLDRGGRDTLREFRGLMRNVPDRPLFAYVNIMEVHCPYDPPWRFYPYAPWRRRRTRPLTTTGTIRHIPYNVGAKTPPADYVPTIRTLYRAAARYEDWLVAGMIEAIRASGRPTVVVAVADHGENLGEHGLYNHNSSLHETLLHVPLVLWGHRIDLDGGWQDRPIGLTGLPAWILRVVDGAPAPMKPEDVIVSEYESTLRHSGIPPSIASLMDSLDPAQVPSLFRHPGVAVRRGSLKYQAVDGGPHALFDLASDPDEEHDLLPGRRDLGAGFEPVVEAWRARRAGLPVASGGEVAEDEITDHLRMLGYLE